VIHMDKWLRQWIAYRRTLRDADIIVHVIDARNIFETLNKGLNKYKSKLLVAVNKCDLVPDEEMRGIPKRLYGYKHVLVSGKTGFGMHQFYMAVNSMARTKPAKVAMVGYPNVGKSLLMNRLGRRSVARVSPIPGETKGVQWVNVGDFFLMDTPGVIPESEHGGKELVMKGAVRADKIPSPEPIAEEILEKFMKEKPDALAKLYDIVLRKTDTPDKLLERIARRRGKLLKAGELNLFETAKLVIRDYQIGKLSKR